MTETQQQTNVRRYIGWFALIYVGATIIVGIVLSYLEIDRNIGVGIGVLMASSFFVSNKFIEDERRVPTKTEQRKLVWGSIFVLIAFSLFVLGLMFVGSMMSGDDTSAILQGLPVMYLLIAVVVMVGIHWLILNFIYGGGSKKLAASKNKDEN